MPETLPACQTDQGQQDRHSPVSTATATKVYVDKQDATRIPLKTGVL